MRQVMKQGARPLRLVARLSAALAVLVLAACSMGRTGVMPVMLDLGAPQVDALAASTSAPARPALVLEAVQAAPLLTDTLVIWREAGSSEPHGYQGYRWVATPASLVDQRLRERLSVGGPVLAQDLTGAMPHLQVRLERFEQIYTPESGSSQAHVVLSGLWFGAGQAPRQFRFDQVQDVSGTGAVAGVQALALALERAMQQVEGWLQD
ncbi:MAG: ABC-type transport auxiliary lipoprotein family protein [Corticimicrobacter sp.]|uniref:ABC-type transport auxiliary lipoprotein family protein n=1 Tax=Corticimicrobacter sp. TaxID=2678536 RepID=UPI0032DB4D13